MKSLVSTLFVIQLLSGCKTQPSGRNVAYKELIGCWVLQKSEKVIAYPEICFNADSSVIFSSRADTMYNFRIRNLGSYLNLVDQFQVEFNFPVIDFKRDTLEIMDIMVSKRTLIYKKR